MYTFLVLLTNDVRLVQYWIASPAHHDSVVDLHNVMSEVVEQDKAACQAWAEKVKGAGTDMVHPFFNDELKVKVNAFVEAVTSDGCKKKRKRAAEIDENDSSGKKRSKISTALLKNLHSSLFVVEL